LRVLGIVVLGELALDRHLAQRPDLKALALEAGDDLAREPAPEGIGLYEDQRAFHPAAPAARRPLIARPPRTRRPASRARLRAFSAWGRPPAGALPAPRLARSDACGPLVLVYRAGVGGTRARAFGGSPRCRGRLADLAAIAFQLRGGAPARHAPRGRRRRDLGLAVGTDRPRFVERPRAALAALAQFAQAPGAAQVVALDGMLAVRALARLELSQAR